MKIYVEFAISEGSFIILEISFILLEILFVISNWPTDQPYASDITNFHLLYTMYFGSEILFVISEIHYNEVHYVKGLLSQPQRFRQSSEYIGPTLD